MKHRPIGFLDSGVGGLTVVKEVMKILPNEEIYYIGDSARNPYGPRPLTQVREFTLQLASFLERQGIKLLVVACNTATVAALEVLKENLSIPVVGVIESGSRAAVAASRNKQIGVIGTQGTIHSNEYETQILKLSNDFNVQSVACPRFVSIVEKHQYEDELAKTVVSDELKPFVGSNMDTLVLGCTHYPLLQNIIQEYFGSGLILIDPGIETAKQVRQILTDQDILNDLNHESKGHTFFTTGPADKFSQIALNWLGQSNFVVKHVDVEELIEDGE